MFFTLYEQYGKLVTVLMKELWKYDCVFFGFISVAVQLPSDSNVT